MFAIRDLPLKRKLLYGLLATCMTALAFASTALFWFQSVQFRKGFVAELESLGAIMARNSAAPLAFGDRRSASEVLEALKVKPQITSARVFDGGGEVFASFGADEAVEGESRVAPSIGVTFDHGHAIFRQPILLEDAKSGVIEIHASFVDQYRRLLSLYTVLMIAVLSGSLGVILLMSSALQRIITGPIVALSEVARRICAQEDYSARAQEAGKDEVGLLTRTFNQMLVQIESRDNRLRESEQRYEVAVLGSSDGLWDWDLATNRVYFSPRWKSMLGYDNEELVDSFDTFEALLHPEDVVGVKDRVTLYLAGKESSYEVEFRLRHKDGSYRWILTRGVALRDAAGKPFRFAGSHTDITERKQAETELRISREKFETLVNSIDGVVWEADLKTSAFTFISSQAERLLGYPRSAWLEEASFWADHIHPDDREATLRECSSAVARRQVLNCEYRMIAIDGREVWIRDIASMAEGTGGGMVLRGVLYDITQPKLAAHELALLNQQLMDASRAAGMAEVATGVLHNVGNVLNSVNVSASVVQDRLKESKLSRLADAAKLLQEHEGDIGEFLVHDPKGKLLPGFLIKLSAHLKKEQEEAVRELDSLARNIEHIKEIVAMQQSYAKVSGVTEILSPVQVVEDVLRMNEAGFVRHGIVAQKEYGEVPAITMDKHKVMQIVVNLVRNAKHAVTASEREDKKLVVRVRRAEGEGVAIEVEDNGVGIAPENLTKIFGHGFTTKKEGHGFGLHSGALAAKEMGGSLSVTSDGPGRGATFRLELPPSPSRQRKPAGDGGSDPDETRKEAA